MKSIRIAYVPEHFSTPLFFASQEGYYKEKGLEVVFEPVPEGTGRLISLLNEKKVDFAVGLTEGFVADISKGNDSYKIVGTYVNSPLCWSISTGYNRDDINKSEDLAGKTIGISRIGSGSYIMSFVFGLESKFPEPFFSDYSICSNFKNLRDSVNHVSNGTIKNSDAFMWEYFTSKKYYDNKEIKKIGEIYTPWPSWVITARTELVQESSETVKDILESIKRGIKLFEESPERVIEYISENLDYSKQDAREWMKTVAFNNQLGAAPIDRKKVIDVTCCALLAANVLTDKDAAILRLEKGVHDL